MLLIGLRDETNSDGKKSVRIHFFQGKINVRKNLGFSVSEQNFLNGVVTKKEPNYKIYNLKIQKIKNDIENYLIHCELNDVIIEEDVICNFISQKKNNGDFFDFVEKYINENKRNVTSVTIQRYRTEYNKLKIYRPELKFSDINFEFVEDYENYVVSVLKSKINTVNKTMTILSLYVKSAIKKKLMKDNPFKEKRFKKENPERVFLTYEEVMELEKLFELPLKDWEYHVLTCFLFACYTGLRYSDVKNLKESDVTTQNEVRFIDEKTNTYNYVPLTKNAKKIYYERRRDNIKPYAFKVTYNQTCNDVLKRLAVLANLKKYITFHTARHTFATISLTIGIRMEVVQKLLGHKDLKTTQIYAKIVDTVKNKEMKLWDSL